MSLKTIHSDFLNEAENMVNKYLDTCSTYLTKDEIEPQKLQKISENLKETIKVGEMIRVTEDDIECFENLRINNNSIQESDLDEIEKKYEEELRKLNEDSLSSLWDSNEVLKRINSLLAGDDDDGNENESQLSRDNGATDEIVTTQQDINLIDPITKMRMTDPVRHIPCGHVYERKTVLAMIDGRKRKGFRCPYMGCSYRQKINKEDLEDALDYRRALKNTTST